MLYHSITKLSGKLLMVQKFQFTTISLVIYAIEFSHNSCRVLFRFWCIRMVSDGLDFSRIASTAPLNLKSLKSWNIFVTRWQRDFVPVEIDVEIGKTSFQAPSVWLFLQPPPPWVCLKIHTSRKLFGGLRAYLIKNSRQFLVPKRSEIRHTHIANGTEALHSLQRGHCMTSHPQSMHHSKESIKFEHRSYSIKFHPPKKKMVPI